jgi:SulP family sulfate permease
MGSLFEALYRIDQIKLAPFALGVIVIAAATLSGRLFPKAPAPLLAVLAAVLLGNIFGLHDKELGKLPMEIPPLVGFSWTPTDVISVLPQAFALAFVSSVNLLITSRVVEHFRGKHTPVKAADADRELGAYSIANLAAGVFGAPMSVGIPARSLANVRCGGNSRMSNIFHALFLILFLYVGSDFIGHIPVPALGGVIAWMGFCLLDWSTWRRLHKMRYTDAAAFIVTAVSVLLVNAVAAVAFGCLIYMGQSALLRVAAYLENLKPRYVADVTE